MCRTEQGCWPPLLASTSPAQAAKHTVTVTKRSTKRDIDMVSVGAKLRLGSGALAGDVIQTRLGRSNPHRNNVFNIYREIETLDNKCLIYLMMTHPMTSWIFLISHSAIVSGA